MKAILLFRGVRLLHCFSFWKEHIFYVLLSVIDQIKSVTCLVYLLYLFIIKPSKNKNISDVLKPVQIGIRQFFHITYEARESIFSRGRIYVSSGNTANR